MTTTKLSNEYQAYLNTFNKAQLLKFIDDKEKLRMALTFQLFEAQETGEPTDHIVQLRAETSSRILYAKFLEAGTHN